MVLISLSVNPFPSSASMKRIIPSTGGSLNAWPRSVAIKLFSVPTALICCAICSAVQSPSSMLAQFRSITTPIPASYFWISVGTTVRFHSGWVSTARTPASLAARHAATDSKTLICPVASTASYFLSLQGPHKTRKPVFPIRQKAQFRDVKKNRPAYRHIAGSEPHLWWEAR